MMVVYRGPNSSATVGGVRFDRDVPTWMRSAGPLASRSDFEDWTEGRPSARGREVRIIVGNTARWLLALPAIVRSVRQMYPTCPIRVVGSDMFVGLADAWPGVQAEVSARKDPDVYREHDLRKGATDYFLQPLHLKFLHVQYQATRMLLGDAGPRDSFVPETVSRKPGDHVVLLASGVGGWPELVDALRDQLGGIEVRALGTSTAADARQVRSARAVIAVRLHPLLAVARLCEVPGFALVDGGPDVSEIQQLVMDCDTFAFDYLSPLRRKPPAEVAAAIISHLGLSNGTTSVHTPAHEAPVTTRRRRRNRQPDAEPSGDAGVETDEADDPEHAGDADLPDPDPGRFDP